MKQLLKKSRDFLVLTWLFGGGPVISLLLIIWSWKLCVGCCCAWLMSWILIAIYMYIQNPPNRINRT